MRIRVTEPHGERKDGEWGPEQQGGGPGKGYCTRGMQDQNEITKVTTIEELQDALHTECFFNIFQGSELKLPLRESS